MLEVPRHRGREISRESSGNFMHGHPVAPVSNANYSPLNARTHTDARIHPSANLQESARTHTSTHCLFPLRFCSLQPLYIGRMGSDRASIQCRHIHKCAHTYTSLVFAPAEKWLSAAPRNHKIGSSSNHTSFQYCFQSPKRVSSRPRSTSSGVSVVLSSLSLLCCPHSITSSLAHMGQPHARLKHTP